MESLGYLWVYLARGRLPWQGITDCAGPAKIERIGQMKIATPVDVLCDGLPPEFATFISYARALRPYEMPDHAAARQMFRSVAERLCPDDDEVFDWIGVDLDAGDDGDSTGDNYPTRSESDEELAPISLSRLST